MAIIKISEENGGIWAEEATPDPKTIYIGDELRAELEQINTSIASTISQPDTIEVHNDSKYVLLDSLNSRKQEIEEILKSQ